MDVNGTRFHLLLGKANWSTPEVTISVDEDGVLEASWDEERAAISLAPRVFLPPQAQSITRQIGARRGSAADRYGNVYRIADDRSTVMVRSSGSGNTSVLWPVPLPVATDVTDSGAFHEASAPPSAPQIKLSGLAITCHHRMIIGFTNSETGETGLLVFDLFAPAPPLWVVWPVDRIEGGLGFEPFDIAPLADGGVLILDRAHHCLWGLDAELSALALVDPAGVQTSPFKPTPEAAGVSEETSVELPIVTLAPLRYLPTTSDPVAIEVIAKDLAVVLENPTGGDFANVRVVNPLGPATGDQVLSTEGIKDQLPPDIALTFSLVGHDMALVALPDTPSGRAARLYIVPAQGLQAYAFDLLDKGQAASPRYSLAASPGYFPMHGYTNRAVIVYAARPYYDDGDHWILLSERPRRRYRRHATLTTRLDLLDARQPACVWHRILVDGVIPRTAEVKLFTRAAEDPNQLNALPWQEEPKPILRKDGREIPYVASREKSESVLVDEEGTWDTLIQGARGRYLQLKVEFSGDGITTPRLSALRIYYPRFSYMERYLPSIYRQDTESASFVDRFLSLFEGFYTPIEDRIAATQALLDVQSAPPEALDWLASWLGVALDPAWGDLQRRLFLRHAADFFRWRGTMRGLITALELAITNCPDERVFDESIPLRRRGVRIVEKFISRRFPGVIVGDPTEDDSPREIPTTGLWQPSQGREVLSQRYRDALASAGIDESLRPMLFPVHIPDDETRGIWRTFAKQTLGFIPFATETDAAAWRAFLARRHGTVEKLNLAYSTSYLSFASIAVPTDLPSGGPALVDWYTFEGQFAIERYAHQFVVVLPVRPGDSGNTEDYQERKRLAERIAALEKPAHTTFEVRFYWAMFRVGEVRLGTDSQVYRDRAPELLGPFVLDKSYVAQGYLAPRPPNDALDRMILGRDALKDRSVLEET